LNNGYFSVKINNNFKSFGGFMGFLSSLFTKTDQSLNLNAAADIEPERKPFVVPENSPSIHSIDVSLKATMDSPAQGSPEIGSTILPQKIANFGSASSDSSQNASPKVAEINQDERQSVVKSNQLNTLEITQEDVIAAYKIFLKRLPESMDVINLRVKMNSDRLLIDFLSSSEFLNRAECKQLIFSLAKKIMDEEKLKSVNTEIASDQNKIAD
jgi:hypothetical protein